MIWTDKVLQDLAREKLDGCKLIVVSNREPFIHRRHDGRIVCVRPASGMAAAVDAVMRACGGIWIAHGSGDADRESSDPKGRVNVPPEEPRYTLRRIWLTAQQELGYYYGLSNSGLWPLCHIVFRRPVFSRRDWDAYCEVNEVFAEAVLEEAGDSPAVVFIQDYHFGLLPRLLKNRNPDLVVAQFWHIPWPNR
ncbi:MAG: trehalose-6-phosphate synthase, partial [Acidobacteria bacterium]|nr:trehalose-6-phosphate synthase [Acidobacteriota bacterium]